MNIFWYSFDAGAVKNVFNHLPEDPAVRFHAAFGRPMLTMEIRECIHSSSLVVLSPSSFSRDTDIRLLKEVCNTSVPCVLVADSHDKTTRGYLKKFAPHLYCVVASPVDIELAEKFRYKEVFYCGGPPAWNEWYDTAPILLPRTKGEILVLMSGLKQPSTSNHVLKHALEALSTFDRKWRLIFASHPSEDRDLFEKGRRENLLSQAATLERDQNTPIEALTRSVDMVIMAGHSTVGITAAHQRQRVICFTDGIIRRHNEQQQTPPVFLPAKRGAVLLANQLDFPRKIERLFTAEGYKEMKRNQVKLYPGPSLPNPATRILWLLKSLAT